VTEARAKVGQTMIDPTKATPAELQASVKAMGDFQTALSRLLVVVENYPQLKATENFLVLQSQLEGTENRISTERRRFNEAVNEYNKHIQKFPANVVLGIVAGGKFKTMEVFKAGEDAQTAPRVDFGNR
jgi:LemA protein